MKYLVLFGSVESGHKAMGPFDTYIDAMRWIQNHDGLQAQIMPIVRPT